MAVSPSFCFSDTNSESVLSCSSNSYYIVYAWWQYLVGAWQFIVMARAHMGYPGRLR